MAQYSTRRFHSHFTHCSAKPPPQIVGIRLPAAGTKEIESAGEFDDEGDDDDDRGKACLIG